MLGLELGKRKKCVRKQVKVMSITACITINSYTLLTYSVTDVIKVFDMFQCDITSSLGRHTEHLAIHKPSCL